MEQSEARRQKGPVELLVGVGEKRPGSAVPCDMRLGPCACGAWHNEGDPGKTLLEALWASRSNVEDKGRRSRPVDRPVGREYITQAGESLMGIAARELRDEMRWREVAAANFERWPGLGPHDYYPPGSRIMLPDDLASAAPVASSAGRRSSSPDDGQG